MPSLYSLFIICRIFHLLLTPEPPNSTDLLYGFGVLCTKLCSEDGAEASGSEYAAGGSSGFEDEAYGDVPLAKNDSLPHFGGGNNIFSKRFLRPPIKKRMRARGKKRAKVRILDLNASLQALLVSSLFLLS